MTSYKCKVGKENKLVPTFKDISLLNKIMANINWHLWNQHKIMQVSYTCEAQDTKPIQVIQCM